VPIDTGQNVRVSHGIRLNQIHMAAQQVFQGTFGTEKIVQANLLIVFKLNQEINIAARYVEIILARRRPEHVQPPNIETLANSGDTGAVLGDSGVHGGILVGGEGSAEQYQGA
jgi:hypothetical protein